MIYLTRLGSATAYPLAILLLGMGRTPLAIIELMGAVGLIRAASALLVPAFGFDRTESAAVTRWMQKYSSLTHRAEVVALIIVMFASGAAAFVIAIIAK